MSQKPAFVINILVPPGSFDVNISPDKREILLTNYRDLLGRSVSAL
jgi:DNA mismatch repair ATPase MutL